MLSILLNPVSACVRQCFCPLDLALLGLSGASDRGMCRSKGGDQRKTFLPSAKNSTLAPERESSWKYQDPGSRKQHINAPEEPEHMENTDSGALKKPVGVFLFQTIV
ncbi:hypothetical protein TNCV_613811 [Trichonephila clavipes]|nr:hypothetical protein TNCV_613811 [Trichonephila clavipes]